MNTIVSLWIAVFDKNKLLLQDIGLLVARVALGGMMLALHGWGKLNSYAEEAASFPDPLGVGPVASMTLAVFAEFFCALALVLGLATRFAALNLFVTMLVAALIVHWADPIGRKELALVYLFPFLLFILTGPGRLSLDHLIGKKLKGGAE